MVEFAFDVLAVLALGLSTITFIERWRAGERSRQEANIIALSNQINNIYDMVDSNLADVLESRGKVKLKNGNDRERFLMLQKLHVHLDTIQMMIKLESSRFKNMFLGKVNNSYYRELVEWYCSVHKFYNDLLDLFKIEDSSFLHDGMKDPHRTKGTPPVFLVNNKYAKAYHSCPINVDPNEFEKLYKRRRKGHFHN